MADMTASGTATRLGTLSDDAFLDGRLSLRQPKRGHRAGLDAVLLAAFCRARPGETVCDIGAGVGAAGLCAATLNPGIHAHLIERDADLAALAGENARRNHTAAVVACGDVTETGALKRLNLAQGLADHALTNPPFHPERAVQPSADGLRRAAHLAPEDLIGRWMRFAAALVRPGGTLSVIYRADSLGDLLAATTPRFGDLVLLPVHPRPGTAATRVLLHGVRDSRAPLRLMPGLVLHGAAGHGFRSEVEAILRGRARLDPASGEIVPLDMAADATVDGLRA